MSGAGFMEIEHYYRPTGRQGYPVSSSRGWRVCGAGRLHVTSVAAEFRGFGCCVANSSIHRAARVRSLSGLSANRIGSPLRCARQPPKTDLERIGMLARKPALQLAVSSVKVMNPTGL